ncbi:MAG: ABC transporter ATP-binding protein [Candidatus Omnitrophica bacterium]|nr:ABC transporter ATP-binding protein [Candidatus Omnitrophota bacterium]
MIAASNLNRIFRQGTQAVHAVNGVDLEVRKGERVYIHGPSGAGKSTLLHMLGALMRPSGGTASFRGKEIYAMTDRQRSALRNRSFGFIFQFYHLLPELSVLENVMLPARIMGGASAREIRAKAVDILERVKMDRRLTHRPSQLSGGETQRAAIARALVNSPDILFCDEPAGNLDSEMSREIYGLILENSEKNAMSVIVISHQTVAEGFFHSEYVMKDGVLRKGPGCKSEYQGIRVSVGGISGDQGKRRENGT